MGTILERDNSSLQRGFQIHSANTFLWRMWVFNTTYLHYRLKTLVVGYFTALISCMKHGNKINLVNSAFVIKKMVLSVSYRCVNVHLYI